jgi:hypothetical protein
VIGIALDSLDAVLVLNALEAFADTYASRDENRRACGIMSALRAELHVDAVGTDVRHECGNPWIEDDGAVVIECRRAAGHASPWHSDAVDGDGRLWRQV